MSKMTTNNEFENLKLIDLSVSPHSMDKNQKFEERLKRQKRFSRNFESSLENAKLIKCETQRDDLETENLMNDHLKKRFQCTKRKSESYIADITNTSLISQADLHKTNEHFEKKCLKIQSFGNVTRKSVRNTNQNPDLHSSKYPIISKINTENIEDQFVKRKISDKRICQIDEGKDSKENNDKFKNVATNVNSYRKHRGFEESTNCETIKMYTRRKSKINEEIEKNRTVVTNSTENISSLPVSKINPGKNNENMNNPSKFERSRKENVTRTCLSKKDSSTDFSEVPLMAEQIDPTLRPEHPSTEIYFQTVKPDEKIEEDKITTNELQFENNYYEHLDILKHYTNRTIEKSNNLETIFEQPKGEIIMGKRKLKRYLNLEETFNTKKQTKRRNKARKLNPYFRMESLNWNKLKLTETDLLD